MSLEKKFMFNGSILVPDKPIIKIEGEFKYDGKYQIEGILSNNSSEFDVMRGCLLNSYLLGPRYNINVLVMNTCENNKTKDLYFLTRGIDDVFGLYKGLVVPSSEAYNYLPVTNFSALIEYLSFMCDEKLQRVVKLELGKLE
jgi:hypothetical protein